MYVSPYDKTAYLLQEARKYRYRDERGHIDVAALRHSAKLLPTAPELTQKERDHLGAVLQRIDKSVIDYSGLAEAGYLDERFGFPIVIEVRDGDTRIGVSATGEAWEHRMLGCGYGFLLDTVARDAEEIDVLIGPSSAAQDVYIIAQMVPITGPGIGGDLDEYKLAIGFESYELAEACYAQNWGAERIGQILTMPLEILRGLLGFEAAPSVIAKAVAMACDEAVVYYNEHGITFGRITKACARTAKSASIAKAVWRTAYINDLPDSAFLYIEPGGEKDAEGKTTPRTLRHFVYRDASGAIDLPHLRDAIARAPQAKLSEDVIARVQEEGRKLLDAENAKSAVSKTAEVLMARAHRCAKALAMHATWKGAPKNIDDFPEYATHPARSAPFSGMYDSPQDVGGWLGWIEPDDESWIAFVDELGNGLLWVQREADGGVIGEPFELKRPDLASTAIDGPMHGLVSEQMMLKVHLCPVAKGLDAATPIDRRIVYGVALEPEPFGGRGDAHDETYSEDVVRRAAYGWLASFANFNDSHGRFLSTQEIVPVESFIAPCDFEIGGSHVRKGSWVIAARIVSDPLWVRVLNGELTAWSIEGHAERECNRCHVLLMASRGPAGNVEWLCPTCDSARLYARQNRNAGS